MKFSGAFKACFALLSLAAQASAAPATQAETGLVDRSCDSSGWWFSNITRQGTSAFGTAGYKVFRNVKDYGAKGDGVTDDTAAINQAIADGNRCGLGCQSQTTTPAIIYFPPGTYMVSTPIVQFYYTQLVGDYETLPTLKATAGFTGMAVIDSDPYQDGGVSWWVNQNNFFRQVRNFIIDLTAMPTNLGAGIHWQVAQATSLQNIVFNMRTEANTKQMGIFMDNGSGSFFGDLVFNGGQYGAFFGNQQFMSRNMTFNGCQTAIFMNWNWVWVIKDVTINNCGVGLDISVGGTSQTVGSVLFVDSVISNTPIGVSTNYLTSEAGTNGTLIIDNVDMSKAVPVAVQEQSTGRTVLAGNVKVASFVQGNKASQTGGAETAVQGTQAVVPKTASLLTASGSVFSRSKPQYGDKDAGDFLSVKSAGAKGDGVTDDTAAIQAVLNAAKPGQVVYFDQGAYIITSTVKVPKNTIIVGEIWPQIMASGAKFANQNNPVPVFQIGQVGDVGSFEMSDMIFSTAGPAPGAILIEWNIAESSQGAAAMWDVHTRVGGAAGTKMQLDQCTPNAKTPHGAVATCMGAYMLVHVTSKATAYFENTWFWVADHSLEPYENSQQIDIYNGRGVLVESQGPVWFMGTAAEHSVLYNYQFSNAKGVYVGMAQTETPYFQGNPDSTTPYTSNATYNDPSFASCTPGTTCARSWGMRIVDSSDIFVYGTGMYNFFNNYSQTCLVTEDCQETIASFENSKVHAFGINTKAGVNMLKIDGTSVAKDADNRNNFCATIAMVDTAC